MQCGKYTANWGDGACPFGNGKKINEKGKSIIRKGRSAGLTKTFAAVVS